MAASFQDYSKRVKAAENSQSNDDCSTPTTTTSRKKFAIDLRTPEEMQQELEEQETEAWDDECIINDM